MCRKWLRIKQSIPLRVFFPIKDKGCVHDCQQRIGLQALHAAEQINETIEMCQCDSILKYTSKNDNIRAERIVAQRFRIILC